MPTLSSLGRDLRHALRALRAARSFTVTTVLTLALGIGVNTAVFSVVNALLFRPLPVRSADRLAVLATQRAPSAGLRGLSYPEIEEYRAGAAALIEDVSGYTVGFSGVAPEEGSPARVLVTWVTGNYFPLLGISAAAGRLLDVNDVVPGRVSPVVVLGFDSWRSRFNADPGVVGRNVLVNGRACMVIGVAPRGFTGAFAFSDPELYLPLNWLSADVFSDRAARGLHSLALLRPGVSIREANALLDVIARRSEAQHPDTNTGIRVTALPERLARPEEDNARSNAFGGTIILLLVVLVFVAAQVNVMNLLLARAATRRRELAIRVAVGASRARLVQQLVIETTLLAIAGGGAGVLLGSWITGALAAVRLPGNLPVRLDFRLDSRVLVYACALTCLTAATVGVLAALRASRVTVDALRGGSAFRFSRAPRLRTWLIVAQMAACFVLLVAATMFSRSLREARQIDLGFDPRGVLNVQMDAAQVGYDDERGRALFDEIERRVRRVPAVEDLSYACTPPMGYVRLSAVITRYGVAASDDHVSAGMNIVGADYFRVMRIPILQGRAFDGRDMDRAMRVAIVNPQLANVLWPGESPLGRRFSETPHGPLLEVIGVAAAGKYRQLFEEPQPYFYVPVSQRYTALRVLHVRTRSSPPESLAPEVEGVIRALEPALPLYDVQSMTDALDGGYGFFLVRTAAIFAAVLGALAAALAIVGLYGVVSCAVTERSREIGIRLALGASARNIARLVFLEGALLAGTGAVIGAVAAIAVARVISRALFGVAPTDPISFITAAMCLGTVTLVAVSVPAARAMATDPIEVLRE